MTRWTRGSLRHPTRRRSPCRSRSSDTVVRSGTKPALGGARRDEPEERPVERVDPGRDHPDPAEPEREDRVLAVARVVRRRAIGGDDREVRLAAEPVMQGAQEMADRLARPPGVLEPARADLRVGAAVDPALLAIRRAEGLVVAQVAVVAERVAARPGRRTAACPASASVESRDGRRRCTSALVVSTAPTRSRPGSSAKARTSRYEPRPPSPVGHAAPQPNPAIPKRSSFSVNGHSSSSRNGSAERTT